MDPYTTFQLNHRSQTQKKLKMDHWDPDLSGVHSKKISKMNWLEFRKAFLSHNTSFMLKTKNHCW